MSYPDDRSAASTPRRIKTRRIERLPQDAIALIRSGVSVPTVGQVAEELLANAIDAGGAVDANLCGAFGQRFRHQSKQSQATFRVLAIPVQHINGE
jgi:hypothetical protein